jgi:hypothetical protein
VSTEERIEPLAGNRHGSPNFSYKVRPSYIDILATISQLAVTALYAPEMLQGGVDQISGVHGQNSFQSNDLIPTGAGVPSHTFHRKLEISPSSSTLDREHDFVPRTPSSLTIAQIEARYDMLLDRMKHNLPANECDVSKQVGLCFTTRHSCVSLSSEILRPCQTTTAHISCLLDLRRRRFWFSLLGSQPPYRFRPLART